MLLKRSVIKINVADAVVVCEAIDIEDNGTFPSSVDWQINARGKFNLNPASRARSSVTIPVYQMSDSSDRFLLRFLEIYSLPLPESYFIICYFIVFFSSYVILQ